MRTVTLVSLCGGAALFVAGSASANYVGLGLTYSLGAPSGRVVWRVYAYFSDPDDYLTAVYGSPAGSVMTIESFTTDNTGAGSSFYNPVNQHGSAPTHTDVFGGTNQSSNPIPPIANAQYDTFFTIGVHAGQYGTGPFGADATVNQSMPADFINGTSYSSDHSGWSTNGPAEQGRAGWTGDDDSELRVMIMQLTVSSTSQVRGTVNIDGINNTPLAGGQAFTLFNQTFNSVPAPGVPMLLGLGGLFGRRRRADH